ncbi:MAG: sulfotransferase family protein [Thermoplasmatota archaeon]
MIDYLIPPIPPLSTSYKEQITKLRDCYKSPFIKMDEFFGNIFTEFLRKWRGITGPLPKPEKWCFIVGCTNSGNTLFQELLSHHPDIGTMPGEGEFYTDQFKRARDLNLGRGYALDKDKFYLDEKSGKEIDLEKLKRQWGAKFDDPSKPVLLEKTPANTVRVRWLQEHFKDPHFIGIVRNGYAVAEGIRRKRGFPLDIASKQWLKSNRILLEDFKRLNKTMIIKYENLAENTKETLIDVAEFIGLDTENFDIEDLMDRSYSIHEKDSSIKNMNHRSFKSLSSDDFRLIRQITGEMLDKFDYEDELEKYLSKN